MKRVFSHDSIAEVGLVRELLERAGIACLTKNEQLGGALGEIPFLECRPELWVVEDRDVYRAEAIVKRHLDEPAPSPAWRCADCGELNEGQFSACWRCGRADDSD